MVGTADPEEFIQSFNRKMVPYLVENPFWKRDFGLWHTQFNFKSTPDTLVVQLMMKGDFAELQKLKALKNHNMLLSLTIVNH